MQSFLPCRRCTASRVVWTEVVYSSKASWPSALYILRTEERFVGAGNVHNNYHNSAISFSVELSAYCNYLLLWFPTPSSHISVLNRTMNCTTVALAIGELYGLLYINSLQFVPVHLLNASHVASMIVLPGTTRQGIFVNWGKTLLIKLQCNCVIVC